MGVYLASVLIPNLLRQPLPHQEGLDLGMMLFVVFCGAMAAIMAYAAGPQAGPALGEKARRAILTIAGASFWTTFSVNGLAHISGPHRPDMFYGLSVSLMVAALLFVFADRFLSKWQSQTPSR